MEPVETPINIDTVNPVLQPVSIDTRAEGDPTPSAPVADVRAKKASIGLGELLGKSQPELYGMLMQGKENELRQEAATKLDAINEQNRVQRLIDLVAKQGKTLTIDEMEQLRKPRVDPNSVFEAKYVEKYLNNTFPTAAAMNGIDMDTAMSVAPDVVMSDLEKGKEILGNYEYARRKAEDIEQLRSNQGVIPWLYDEARTFIPFYNTIKLHAWLKNSDAIDNWLPGSNLEAQTRELLRLPGKEFRAKLDEVLERLTSNEFSFLDKGNLVSAQQYIQAVLGMSTSEVGVSNLMTAVDVSSLPLTAAAKAGLKSVLNVRKGIKDAVQEAGKMATPTASGTAEAFGDAGNAAVLKASENIIADMKGAAEPVSNTANLNTVNDPIRRAREALPTGLQLDKENIAANPGPLHRELLNRITQDQDVASKAIVDVIEKTAAVQRIPIEEAGPIVLKRIKDEVANQNPGIKNAIGDIGDPVWNPFSKSYDFPMRIIAPTGEQFSTEAAARRFARENGIAEYELTGKSGAKYYIPEAAVKREWESTPRLGEVIAKEGQLTVKTVDGAEIQTSLTPTPGSIPISVDKNGKVTFHPTIKTEAEVAKATIEQKGLGFHLNIFKPLNEGQSIIKDLMVNLESTKSVASRGGIEAWFNSIFPVGYIRTSDATLSPFETLQRKTAGYSVSNFQKLLQNEVKFIQDLARGRIRVDPVTGEDRNAILSYMKTLSPLTSYNAKQKWGDFKRALAAAPGLKDPNTGRNGYLLSNPYEINEFWRANFNRPASFEEIRAWLAFKRNYENDRVFRSVREYANKARLGAEQHQISYIDKTGNRIQSGFFEGVQLKEMPGGEYPIAIFDGPSVRIRMSNRVGSDYNKINEAIKRGEMVVTELYDPKLRPLKSIPEVGNNYVRYVVTTTANRESKPLSWEQVNRLSGGHFNYDHEFSIKEASIQETRAGNTTYHSYEGDNHFMFVNGRAQGKQIITVLNEVKRLLREGNTAEARNIFENGLKGAQGPAMEWKDFIKKTKPGKDEFGNPRPALININEPYYVVPKGRNILDMDDSLSRRYGRYDEQNEWVSTFQDRTKSGSLADQYKVAYTQERDAENPMLLRNVGSKDNPIYKYEPAKMVDPLVTMNRALNEITRSTVMDDMKIAGVETWLREAEPYLKARDVDEIRSSPWRFFKQSDSPDAFKPGVDKQIVRNLLSNRFKTQQFIGIPSKYDLFMHDTSQKLSDWMYDLMGPKGELVPTWLLTKTTSPVQMLRSFAYHAKLGLYALPQVITQSQTYLTIASLAPRSAPAGTYGALLSQWAKFGEINPEFLTHLDGWATKLKLPGFHGWKVGEWKEAYEEMTSRGFSNVGSEYNLLDTQMNKKFIRGIIGDFLDAGQMFFQGAEQNVRYGAWFTAYKEYRAMNPNIRTMSKTDWDKVLNRADDMSGNMSRASASIMQSGPLALTGQFLTYQMHLAELYWGKRLGETVQERALARLRMHAMYGTMFGATGAFGIAGLPMAETFRKAAYNNGYVVGDEWLSSMLMEGLPAVGLAWATSPDGDIKKGNWYNIADKFGVSGLTNFAELLKSDAKWWTFLAGAAGGIAGNTWANSEGLRRSSWEMMHSSMMTGDQNKEAFQMTIDQWVDVFKEISSVDSARKAFVAVQFGKWLSKSDAYQADVSKANGIFMALTGLNLQNAADNYVVGQAIKEREEDQKKALNHFTREFRRGIMDAENNDWESYQKHMGNAYAFLKAYDYPIENYPKAVAIASKNWETRINSIRQEFYTKNVPASKQEKMGDSWQRFLQTQDADRLYVGPNKGQ